MYTKILLPLDTSDLARKILLPLGSLLGAEPIEWVTLLGVVEPGASQETQDAEFSELQVVQEELQRQGVRARVRVKTGKPAEGILDAIEELKPDLVAMATHGRSGISRWIRGSVAERVLRHCPVPLLMCNQASLDGASPASSFRSIVIPLDGSELAAEVIPHATQIAKLYGSTLHLIRVQPFLYSTVADLGPMPAAWEPENITKALEPIADKLRKDGFVVRVHAGLGDEALEIIKLAEREHADMIAITTHGRSGVSRWAFGSVAERIVRHAPCPLLVLRHQ
ncbi:MAG: universal stress protein [Planctomycetes bacterium]|nr:universal stress protein [Planctomycetota bacterium]